MNEGIVLARVRDVPGGLERVVGLLRRRAFRVRRLSVGSSAGGLLELLLRVDGEGRTPDEVRAALAGLVDVVDVRVAGAGEPPETRELALARLVSGGTLPEGTGRTVSREGDALVVEITGAPGEVEAAIARLRDAGTLAGVVRTGEVALPRNDPPGR